MRFFKTKTHFDFLGKKNIFLAASSAVLLLALVSIATRGMNFGVDFAGGTELQIGFKEDVDPADIRTTLEKLGFEQASVQVFGPPSERQFLVRMQRVALLSTEEGQKAHEAVEKAFPGEVKSFVFDPSAADKIEVVLAKPVEIEALKKVFLDAGVTVADIKAENEAGAYTVHTADLSRKIAEGLKEKFGADKVELNRVEYVGAAVGKSLRNDAVKSMLYAILMIVIYVGLRFDFRFAPGAIVSLGHDALFTAGFYSWTGLEFNLTTVAAILTIIGYSINDTIVIYDRIRENLHGDRTVPLAAVVNRSVNETLSRTILTSGVTALSLLGLLILGVGVIQDFAVAMLVGMISGTYSTIYIAAPLTIFLEEWKVRRASKGERPARPAPPAVQPKQATR